MNISQKSLIIALQKEGLSYQEIADRTNTSVGYCRVVCSQSKNKKTRLNETDLCRYCGEPLVFTQGAKRKQFCSDQCRINFHNRENIRKPYIRYCEYCNKEFVSYGYPKKRFCSRTCQTLAARKGSDGNQESGIRTIHEDLSLPNYH